MIYITNNQQFTKKVGFYKNCLKTAGYSACHALLFHLAFRYLVQATRLDGRRALLPVTKTKMPRQRLLTYCCSKSPAL
jgi:hypothetical protein